MRRESRTRSESVVTTIPSSTFREHAGGRTREPSTSTTQIRQTFAGRSVSPKQRAGVSMPSWEQASRIVEPSNTRTPRPSILSSTMRFGICRGAALTSVPVPEDTEPRDCRLDGARGRLAEPADRRVAHALPDLADQRQLVVHRPARRPRPQPGERFLLANGADAAGHALSARLVTEERGDAHQRSRKVDRLVEGHDDPGAERRARGTGTLDRERDVELVGADEPSRGAPEQDGLQVAAAGDAAREVEQLGQGGAELDLVD